MADTWGGKSQLDFYLHIGARVNTRGITSVATCTTTLTSHLETSGDISLILPGRGYTRGDCL